ncbi:MAG: hypothetical protein ACRESQ_02615 [Gammaproteobacteria bacterium]
MKKHIFAGVLAILALALSGCATRQVVHIQAAPVPDQDNVKFVDERTSTHEVSTMFGTANVYSCHYGISEIEAGGMDPDRMVLLHSYLADKVLNDSKPHTAMVIRFDIYWNRHLHMEGAALGVVGEATSASGVVIGCPDAQEGEYYKAEAPGPNYSPIVIYLDSVIDGRKYVIRTVYPIAEDSDTKSRWPGALTAAVEKTFATLGSMVKRDESITAPSSN